MDNINKQKKSRKKLIILLLIFAFIAAVIGGIALHININEKRAMSVTNRVKNTCYENYLSDSFLTPDFKGMSLRGICDWLSDYSIKNTDWESGKNIVDVLYSSYYNKEIPYFNNKNKYGIEYNWNQDLVCIHINVSEDNINKGTVIGDYLYDKYYLFSVDRKSNQVKPVGVLSPDGSIQYANRGKKVIEDLYAILLLTKAEIDLIINEKTPDIKSEYANYNYNMAATYDYSKYAGEWEGYINGHTRGTTGMYTITISEATDYAVSIGEQNNKWYPIKNNQVYISVGANDLLNWAIHVNTDTYAIVLTFNDDSILVTAYGKKRPGERNVTQPDYVDNYLFTSKTSRIDSISEQRNITPTFMYFVSYSDVNYNYTMEMINELKSEYGDRISFDICNIDETPEDKDGFPVDGMTPALIMLNSSNDIVNMEFQCNDKDILISCIEGSLNGI